jgi:hypothetical protein
MLKFIANTLTLATILALCGAIYLLVGAYNMPFENQIACQIGVDHSAVCKTALLLQHYSN